MSHESMRENSVTHQLSAKTRRILTYLPSVLIAILLIIFGYYLEHINAQAYKQELRSALLNKVSAVRTKLESNINANALLVKGLVVSISIEPDMSQQRFSALSAPLITDDSQLRNIAAAPDLIIEFMHPIEGNEAAIGLDYRTVPEQLKSVTFARDTGELVMTGPVNLVQGGSALIIRMPVFINNDSDNKSKFWGIVSTVIDTEKFFTASGLYDSELDFNISIRNKDIPEGNRESLIFGNHLVFESDPLLTDVILPHGSWQLAAVPKNGWLQNSASITEYRIILFMIGLIVLLPFILLSRSIEKRRETEHRLQALFKFSPIGIALNSYDTGDFIEVNNALLETIGYSYEEFIKLSYWDITPEKYKDDELLQLEALEKTGHYGPYEKEYIRKDGKYIPVLLKGMIILDASGNKLIWSFVEDISKRNEIEKSLQRSQKMDAVGQLTGGIAHDFNNILGIVIGNMELIQYDLPKDLHEVQERIDNVINASQRAADLTKQLLSFSRKKSSKQTVTNINNLVNKMENLIARSVTPEVEIKINIENELWLTKIDQGDFEDAILNLCLNARDAMAGHGLLTISTRNVTLNKSFCELITGAVPGEYIELAVSDTGEGIASEKIDRLFEPFFTTKDEGKGTGLGLAMVYGFVQRSHGCINVSTNIGTGTTFKIYLPRHHGKAEQAVEKTVNDMTELPVGTETILIVDDESALLNLANTLLVSMGYKVFTASSGKQALEVLQQESDIDLLFSDVVMPGGINGYELAEQATTEFPTLKVLLTSGYTGKVLDLNEDTPRKILNKPYSKIELAIQIRSALDEAR